MLEAVRKKDEFWRRQADQAPFSARQQKMLRRLLDEEEPVVTVKRRAAACRCSPDTALRDVTDLVERGLLVRGEEGGKNTRYRLRLR